MKNILKCLKILICSVLFCSVVVVPTSHFLATLSVVSGFLEHSVKFWKARGQVLFSLNPTDTEVSLNSIRTAASRWFSGDGIRTESALFYSYLTIVIITFLTVNNLLINLLGQ